jgi:hypothetical protein
MGTNPLGFVVRVGEEREESVRGDKRAGVPASVWRFLEEGEGGGEAERAEDEPAEGEGDPKEEDE